MSQQSSDISINDFDFYESFSIYKSNISDQNIKTFFDDLKEKKELKRKDILLEIENPSTMESSKYFFIAYLDKKNPRCLRNHSNIQEQDISYILIILYKNYTSICSKNISYYKELHNYITKIPTSIFSTAFISEKSAFKKIAIKNLDIANSAIRAQTFEAEDLKQNITDSQANNYILTNYRAKNKKDNETITVNTSNSKINKLFKWKNIENIIVESENIINTIITLEKSKKKKSLSFIEKFAEPVELSDQELSQLQPVSILVLGYEILNFYEENKNKITLFKDNNKTDNQELENICDKIKNCLIIENNKNRIQIELSKTEFIITKLYEFDKFDISIDNSKTSLLDIINEHNWFILTFDKSEYRYFGGKLFKDTRLLKNIELFSKLWEEQNKSYTTQINSEKGYNHRLELDNINNNIYKNLPTNSTSFPPNSQFNYIEENYNDTDYLICDDLGKEFADYISLDKKNHTISFFHCKWKSSTDFSASAFQDVIGQALKNLGNINAMENILEKKKNSLAQKYSKTEINKLRPTIRNTRPPTPEEAIDAWREIQNFPNSTKHIYLIINFLSKEKFINGMSELKKFASNSNNPNTSAIEANQILWILNSFVSICKQQNVQVHIVNTK